MREDRTSYCKVREREGGGKIQKGISTDGGREARDAKNKPQIIWRLITWAPTEKENDSEICSIINRGFPAHSHPHPHPLAQLTFTHASKNSPAVLLLPAVCKLLNPLELPSWGLLEAPTSGGVQKVTHGSRLIISYDHGAE